MTGPGALDLRPLDTHSMHARDTKTPVDIMYVVSGTTAGLRQADEEMLVGLRGLGVDVVTVTPSDPESWPVGRYVNRSLLTIDVFHAFAVRLSTAHALRSYRPRAIIYSTTHAALLAPRARHGASMAIRFDAPAQMSRTGGALYSIEFWLERRRFRRAALLMPAAVEVGPDTACLLPANTPVVPVPIPIELGDEPRAARDPIAVFYGGSPERKGLDIAVQAWARASRGDRRLAVTGIDRASGVRYLRERGIDVPASVDWTGLLSPDEHRRLTRRAEMHIAASRYEGYGIGQLEALADGATLVTTPSPGPYVALPIARELDPRLVAPTHSPTDLAAALDVALARDHQERVTYRDRARERVRAFSHDETTRRLRHEVLPLLLG
jgi:glycosyltransferase involved in cell wall biosynthesis